MLLREANVPDDPEKIPLGDEGDQGPDAVPDGGPAPPSPVPLPVPIPPDSDELE